MKRLARCLLRLTALAVLPLLRLAEIAGETAGLAFDQIADWAGDVPPEVDAPNLVEVAPPAPMTLFAAE